MYSLIFFFKETLGHLENYGLFLVFDGHRGSSYANTIAKEFATFLTNQTPFSTMNKEDEYDEQQLKLGLREAFLQYDKEKRLEGRTSGTTVSGILITPKHIFVMNIGDSRSLICRSGELFFETKDHKPTHETERTRIHQAGGNTNDCRLNGRLSLSRALGNFEYKNNKNLNQIEQALSPEADITVLERNRMNDDFIVICTDGIFHRMSNQQVIQFLTDRIPYKQNQKDVCHEIMDYCLYKGSKDNISVILLHFDNSSIKQDADKIKQDEDLDTKLRLFTQEYVDEQFANNKSAYGWVHCFNKIDELYKESIFDKHEITRHYGITLKKGVIYDEFDKLVMEIKDKRNQEALRWMIEQREKEQNDN